MIKTFRVKRPPVAGGQKQAIYITSEQIYPKEL